MYTTGLIAPFGLTGILPAKPLLKSQAFSISNPSSWLVVSEHKKRSRFLTSINGGGFGAFSNTKRDLVVYSGVEPGAPLPSDPSPNSWKNWFLGALLAIILPFLRHKWGPLLSSMTKKIDSAVETAEDVAEAIEKVAVEVDKVAEEVAEKLPEGGKLRDAIEFIEDAAEETVKGADLAEEIFNKVEEVEEGVESLVEQGSEKAGEEAKDQKRK